MFKFLNFLKDTNEELRDLEKEMKEEKERLNKHLELLEDIIEEEEW